MPEHLIAVPAGSPEAARQRMPLAEVLAGVEPTEFDTDAVAPAGLVPAAERAVTEAMGLLEEGRSFEAIQRLGEAERVAPDHPRVVRALGLAYVRGGNSVRGGQYLRRAAGMDPADTDTRVVLARMALDRRAWADAAGLAASIDRANAASDAPDPAAMLFADYTRAVAFARQGYAEAARSLYEAVLAEPGEPDPATAAGRELYILQAQADTLRVQAGDLSLALADPARALTHYRLADPAHLSGPVSLAARLAYTHLLLGDPEAASAAVVAHLASPLADDTDAALVGYLLDRGIDPAGLDAQLADAAGQHPGHFPLVAARAVVLPQAQTVTLIDTWLADQPPRLATFRRAIALLRGRGDDRDDPAALARALALTGNAMGRHPQQATDYADALLDLAIDPVALIRALQRPDITQADAPSHLFLVALAYDRVGRTADAYAHYARLLDARPDHPQAQPLIVDALITLGLTHPDDPSFLAEAQDRLGDVPATAEWDRFARQVRLMRAMGRSLPAHSLVRTRLRSGDSSIDLRALSARLDLDQNNVARAIQTLRQMLDAYPTDEHAYVTASELSLIAGRSTARLDEDLVRAFDAHLLAMADEHLPESRVTRYLRAITLFRDRLRPAEARPILESLYEEDPDDLNVAALLRVVCEVMDDHERADALRLEMIDHYAPGISRAYELVRYYTHRDPEKLTAIVRQTLDHAEEGVLPGPPLTGDQAAFLLYRLSLAIGEEASEPDYLRALRMMPDSPSLNNALGYRYAMAGKELLAAELMLRRALEATEELEWNYLDSMGWVYYKMGRFAEAEAYLRRAVAMMQEEARLTGLDITASRAVLYDHLGDILYMNGESDLARQHWRAAHLQNISDEEAALDPEVATVHERATAKIAALEAGLEPPVSAVPGEAALGSGIHPAERGD